MIDEETEFVRINMAEGFSIAWKRRWEIIIITLGAAALAAIVSFLLPKAWDVGAVIQTGRVVEPKIIVGQITGGFYNALVGAELDIPSRDFPDIKAEIQRDPTLIRISFREKEIARGRNIVHALFKHLKSEVEKMSVVETDRAEAGLELARNRLLDTEIDKDIINQRIDADRNKLKIAERRIAGLQAGLTAAKARADEADGLRWEEKIGAERMNIETLTSSIRIYEMELQKNQRALSGAKIALKLAENQRNRIGYVQIVQEPTLSAGPVAPNKRQTVLTGGFLGLCLALGIAFLREYLGRKKKTGSLRS